MHRLGGLGDLVLDVLAVPHDPTGVELDLVLVVSVNQVLGLEADLVDHVLDSLVILCPRDE